MSKAPLSSSASASKRFFVDAMGDLFKTPRDLCRLCLVLLQVWLWVVLRVVDQSGDVSHVVFYAAEGLGLLAVFLLARRSSAPRPSFSAVSWCCALLMAAAPVVLAFGMPAGGALVAVTASAVAGATLAWGYTTYFSRFSQFDLRQSVGYLLLSFAVVPIVRLPIDMLSIEVAALLACPLPVLFLAMLGCMSRSKEGDAAPNGAVPAGASPAAAAPTGFSSRDKLVRVMAELAVFGFAMGLFRVGSGGAYESGVFVAASLVAKVAFPLIVMGAVGRRWRSMRVADLCQTAVVLLLVLMVVAANVPDVPVVSFAVFDFARYAVIVLLFLALLALRCRVDMDSRALFGAGFGLYTVALTAGQLVAKAAGLYSFDAYPSVLVLDVMCALAVVAVLASGAESRSDMRLFADGDAEEAPSVSADRIEERCRGIAGRFGLTKRELETMRLICRGRSKRYIAEHMALSENTVRGYAKTLYAKLDVHSREELLDLLDLG